MQDTASSDVTSPPQRKGEKYERLIARTSEIPAIPTVVVHPCDRTSLEGPIDAAKANIIEPILNRHDIDARVLFAEPVIGHGWVIQRHVQKVRSALWCVDFRAGGREGARATRMIVMCVRNDDRSNRRFGKLFAEIVDEILGQSADAVPGHQVCRW